MSAQSTLSPDNLAKDVQALTIKQPATTTLGQPAVTAVFTTNELLKQILSEVPCEERKILRRVSKTWHEVVSKVGYAVDPMDVPGKDEPFGRRFYPSHIVFKAHPDMTIARFPISTVTGASTTLSIGLGHRRSDAFKQTYEVHNEFVTHPPVTRMAVGIWSIECESDASDYADDLDDSENRLPYDLHIPGGIRFRDVHDLFQCLSQTKTQEGERQFHAYDFFVQMDCRASTNNHSSNLYQSDGEDDLIDRYDDEDGLDRHELQEVEELLPLQRALSRQSTCSEDLLKEMEDQKAALRSRIQRRWELTHRH